MAGESKASGPGGALGPSGPGGLAGVLGKSGGVSVPKPFSREIFLIDTHIAGTTYVENIESIAEKIAAGVRLNFYREPKNEYDANAILIKDETGNRVGYVPKKNNEILARLMDAGKLIYGIVTVKESTSGGWLKIEIEIYLQD